MPSGSPVATADPSADLCVPPRVPLPFSDLSDKTAHLALFPEPWRDTVTSYADTPGQYFSQPDFIMGIQQPSPYLGKPPQQGFPPRGPRSNHRKSANPMNLLMLSSWN